MKVLLFIFIFLFIYMLVDVIYSNKLNEKISKFIKEKNDKYYEDLIKYYDKSKKVKLSQKLNIIYKLNILIDKAGLDRGFFINPITIIILSFITFILVFYFVFSIFKIIMLSIIIALPSIFIPTLVLNMIIEFKANKIENVMLNFLLQLSNYTKINNDIIYAFKQVKTIEPLQSYINKFLIEVNSGIKFEKAIESFKDKISFDKLKLVFSNIQHCYTYGGDFSLLLDKHYKMISKIQAEKTKRKEETKSARIVLGILIFLNLFVYFSFIKNNPENFHIMSRGILGNIILYWNFISIWILILLMNKVKKLEY